MFFSGKSVLLHQKDVFCSKKTSDFWSKNASKKALKKSKKHVFF
jgi:hypothetical protein